jgi:membrane-bound lytic murein transglycosylase F
MSAHEHVRPAHAQVKKNPGNKNMKWGLLILLASLVTTCGQPPSLLEEILSLGELRVVTRNSPTTYYTGAHGAEGFEYDLISQFADFIGVRLKITTTDRFSDLLPAVESGRAHVAAAGLTITPDRSKRVTFGPSYKKVKQNVIYRLGDNRPRNIEQIVGKRLEVVSGSSYVETLEAARIRYPDLIWSENPHADIADLMVDVAERNINYTVADDTLFKVYRNYLPEIRMAFELAGDDELAWAFPRRHDRSLVEQAEAFIAKAEDEGMLKRLEERYYGRMRRFDYVGTRQFIRDYRGKLPAYREMFEAAAVENDLDWRLLAAIGYQESHWDPKAVSPTGVRGIMMLTRNTAGSIGVDDRVDPAQSISGGAEYFMRVKSRFPKTITEPDRTWFALASYNVGYGHVADARRITQQNHENPDLWIDVKRSLPLLAKRSHYVHTRHGYARGWEPLMYVENIRNYFDILVWLSRDSEPANEKQEDAQPAIAEDRRLTQPSSRPAPT